MEFFVIKFRALGILFPKIISIFGKNRKTMNQITFQYSNQNDLMLLLLLAKRMGIQPVESNRFFVPKNREKVALFLDFLNRKPLKVQKIVMPNREDRNER